MLCVCVCVFNGEMVNGYCGLQDVKYIIAMR